MTCNIHSRSSFYSKSKVSNIVEYQKVLHECTSNENWNISNTQLQVLADHLYNWYLLFLVSFY